MLLQELQKAGASWKIEPVVEPVSPTSQHTCLYILATITKPDQTVIQHRFHRSITSGVEKMIAHLMKEQWRDGPGLQAWLESKGNVPVKLNANALDNLPELMHVALRKLADSKQSVITWNALHQMHSSDRAALWDAAQKTVSEAFQSLEQDPTQKPARPPTRRRLATTLKEAVIAALDECRSKDVRDADGDPVRRKDRENFALLAMQAACELTDMDEWMWGWLGYVVDDADESA